jgi:hypothetical protein
MWGEGGGGRRRVVYPTLFGTEGNGVIDAVWGGAALALEGAGRIIKRKTVSRWACLLETFQPRLDVGYPVGIVVSTDRW